MIKRIKNIQKAIDQIRNPFPPDDLINSYRDFLNHRDSLPYYQFNHKVLENLLDLSLNLWHSKKRISRLSLLEYIKRYSRDEESRSAYVDSNRKLRSLPTTLKKKIYMIFKNCFEETRVLTEKQLPEARKISNSLLLNIDLEEEEEKWMITNYAQSPLILNRVLRYPKRSDIISTWAIEHFNDNNLRNRRAELVSWILDVDPQYILDKQILLEDYQYFNDEDKAAVQEIKEVHELNQLLAEKLGNEESSKSILPEIEVDPESELQSKPLKLIKRFYQVPTKFSNEYYESFPDFKELDDHFHNNLEVFHKVTMMWGIGYSRLNKKKKSQLLINYYSLETEPTFFRICKRCKLVEPLVWLKDK